VTERSHPQPAKHHRSTWFLAWFVLLIFFVSCWVVALAKVAYSTHLLASEGRVATATVTNKVMHAAGDAGYNRTTYATDFVFTSADGKSVEGTRRINADQWDRIKQGDTFQVTYAASDPQVYEVGATLFSTTAADLIFLGVSVIWLVLMTLLIRPPHRWATARRAKRSHPSKAASRSAPGIAADSPAPIAAKSKVSGSTMFGTALILVGGLFLLIGVANLLSEQNFRAEAKIATAIVLTKSSASGKSGSSYPLQIRFTTDDGRLHEPVIGVDHQTMSSIHEREPIQIVYSPADLTRIRVASRGQASPPLFLWFISALGGIIAAGGAICIAYGLHDARPRNAATGRNSEPTPTALD